jgi:hypothetical protein
MNESNRLPKSPHLNASSEHATINSAPPARKHTGHPHSDAPNPAPAWLSDRAWRQLRLLSALPAFSGLDAAVAAAPAGWRAVYDSPEPQGEKLPGLFGGLDEFRRLCVMR